MTFVNELVIRSLVEQGAITIPPTMKVVDDEAVTRYLERVEAVWQRMDDEGIRRIAQQGRNDG